MPRPASASSTTPSRRSPECAYARRPCHLARPATPFPGSTPGPSGSLSASRATSPFPPTAGGWCSCARGAGAIRSTACGCWVWIPTPRASASWPIRSCCSPTRTRTTYRRRSAHAGSGLARAPGAWSRTPPMPQSRWPLSRCPAACSRLASSPVLLASSPWMGRCSTRARTRWPGGWPTSAIAGSASRSWTAPAASWPAMMTRTSRGDRPSSSPPRRWTVTAATGGRRTARPSSPRVWTPARSPGGGSATPRTPARRRPSTPTRRRGRPMPM